MIGEKVVIRMCKAMEDQHGARYTWKDIHTVTAISATGSSVQLDCVARWMPKEAIMRVSEAEAQGRMYHPEKESKYTSKNVCPNFKQKDNDDKTIKIQPPIIRIMDPGELNNRTKDIIKKILDGVAEKMVQEENKTTEDNLTEKILNKLVKKRTYWRNEVNKHEEIAKVYKEEIQEITHMINKLQMEVTKCKK